MTNEFKHGSVGTELTQTEWEAIGTHVFDSQATGDILYASSSTQLSRLGIGSNGQVLQIASGIPAWTSTVASLTITSFTTTSLTVTDITADDIGMGTSGSPLSYTAGTPLVAIYATSSNTTSTNAEPFYLKSTMTGAGGYGGRSTFHAYTNVALGSNFMGLKSYTEFGSSGSCAGLASGFCSEIKMPNASVSGTYCALEIEYVAGGTSTTTGGDIGSMASFIYMNNTGDADGDFDDNGQFMRIDGLTAGAGHLLSATSQTLKMNIGGSTTRYLVMSQAEDCLQLGSSSSPITSATDEQEFFPCYFESSGQSAYGMRIQMEKTSATAGAPRALTLRTILSHSSGFAPQGANSVDARVTLETGNTGISGEMHAMESQCRVDAESRTVNGTYAAHKFTNQFGTGNTMPASTFFLRFYDAGAVYTPLMFDFSGLTAGAAYCIEADTGAQGTPAYYLRVKMPNGSTGYMCILGNHS